MLEQPLPGSAAPEGAPNLPPHTAVSRHPQIQLSNHLNAGPGLPTAPQLLTAQLPSHSPCSLRPNVPRDKGHGRGCIGAGFGGRAGKPPPRGGVVVADAHGGAEHTGEGRQ